MRVLTDETEVSPLRSPTFSRGNWWLHMTSMNPRGRLQETIEQREVMRRSQLLSWILLGLFIILLLFVPAAFTSSAAALLEIVAVFGLCLIAWFNRQGWVTLAGTLLVLLTIGATLGVVIGSPDGKVHLIDLPSYDFLSVTVVIGASILPRLSAFIIALLDIALLYGDMLVQPQGADLQNAIYQHGLPAMLGRPSAIVLITAVISYLWVGSMQQAVRRADRAEELRAMQQYFSQIEAERTKQVEEFVQAAIRALSALANGQKGLVLLPADHPWRQQAIFINNQFCQFYKLKQQRQDDSQEVILATQRLLRVLKLFGKERRVLLNMLHPHHFTTHDSLIDEIAHQIYLLMREDALSSRGSGLTTAKILPNSSGTSDER